MKYAVIGLAIAAAFLGGVVFSGGEVYAGDQTRLRALLSDPVVDPFRLNVADFRQRSDRTRFQADVHDVAQVEEVVIGTVSVIANGVVILEEPITIVLGIGHLERDSRLGHIVPVMGDGDTVEVRNAVGELIGTGTLHPK